MKLFVRGNQGEFVFWISKHVTGYVLFTFVCQMEMWLQSQRQSSWDFWHIWGSLVPVSEALLWLFIVCWESLLARGTQKNMCRVLLFRSSGEPEPQAKWPCHRTKFPGCGRCWCWDRRLLSAKTRTEWCTWPIFPPLESKWLMEFVNLRSRHLKGMAVLWILGWFVCTVIIHESHNHRKRAPILCLKQNHWSWSWGSQLD